jgi:hypothetical protein
MARRILIEAFDHTRRLPLLVKMSLAHELHWVDALLQGVRNLLGVHSKTKQRKEQLSYGIIRFDTRRS